MCVCMSFVTSYLYMSMMHECACVCTGIHRLFRSLADALSHIQSGDTILLEEGEWGGGGKGRGRDEREEEGEEEGEGAALEIRKCVRIIGRGEKEKVCFGISD